MVAQKYFIMAIGCDGITYYYHSDKKFRWNFWFVNGVYFKTWERKGCAIKVFNGLRKSSLYKSISLMSCEIDKDIKTESKTIYTK